MQTSKFLFVTFHDVNDSSFGGAQCSRRNYLALSKLGEVEVYLINKKSSLFSLKSAIEMNFPPISNLDKENIIELINKNNIKRVYLDHSLMGSIAEFLKKTCDVKVITFFHNVELDYIDVRFGKSIKKIPYKILAQVNERKSAEHSDEFIALNKRDEKRLNELYGVNTTVTIPITFENRIGTQNLVEKYANSVKREYNTCLFVGAFSHSNYEGIKWFVENIANNISAKTIIVGKGFESKKEELNRENVEVVGFVNDLEGYYIDADCVISPLLSGAGMKVKIAEALMYGKTIFGTSESFEGYDLDLKKVGGKCDTAMEFINMINEYMKDPKKYNAYSRMIFEDNYTNDSAYMKMKEIL